MKLFFDNFSLGHPADYEKKKKKENVFPPSEWPKLRAIDVYRFLFFAI